MKEDPTVELGPKDLVPLMGSRVCALERELRGWRRRCGLLALVVIAQLGACVVMAG